MDDEASDREVALRAALMGAAVARSRFGTRSRRVAETAVDFTKAADVETERSIRALLSELRPRDAILGEELGATGDSARCWRERVAKAVEAHPDLEVKQFAHRF